MTTYAEIYSDDFINNIDDEFIDGFKKLELINKTPYVDLNKVANVFGVKIKYEDLKDSDSGKYVEESREIVINRNHPKSRRRFTTAHELGHCALGHHGISLRSTDLDKYEGTLKVSNEVVANKFAAELLMPSVLIVEMILSIIKERSMDSKSLNENEINIIIGTLAKKLEVSYQAMNYRVRDLGLFN